MAVDLSDYLDSLKRECSPPGVNNYPGATDDDWLGNLADGFWEARLDGLLLTYTCTEDGIVTEVHPSTPPKEMGRDWVHLVVLYASFRILRNTLRGLRTQFKAAAGPVSFEYQQSANLLTALIKELIDRRNIILVRLSDLGNTPDYVIDGIMARDQAIRNSLTFWSGFGDNLRVVDYGAFA